MFHMIEARKGTTLINITLSFFGGRGQRPDPPSPYVCKLSYSVNFCSAVLLPNLNFIIRKQRSRTGLTNTAFTPKVKLS